MNLHPITIYYGIYWKSNPVEKAVIYFVVARNSIKQEEKTLYTTERRNCHIEGWRTFQHLKEKNTIWLIKFKPTTRRNNSYINMLWRKLLQLLN